MTPRKLKRKIRRSQFAEGKWIERGEPGPLSQDDDCVKRSDPVTPLCCQSV